MIDEQAALEIPAVRNVVHTAYQLLQTTNLSIAAIAEQLHFSDQSSFGRFFTRMKGIAPKAYRMERRR